MAGPGKRRPVLSDKVEDYDDSWGESEQPAGAARPHRRRRGGPPRHRAAGRARSHSELVTLEHLMGSPSLGPAEVARRLGVTTAASTTIIDRLAARGRTSAPAPRHRPAAHRGELTPSGRQEVLTDLMPMFQALEQMDAELDADERRVVTAYLQRATAALRAVL